MHTLLSRLGGCCQGPPGQQTDTRTSQSWQGRWEWRGSQDAVRLPREGGGLSVRLKGTCRARTQSGTVPRAASDNDSGGPSKQLGDAETGRGSGDNRVRVPPAATSPNPAARKPLSHRLLLSREHLLTFLLLPCEASRRLPHPENSAPLHPSVNDSVITSITPKHHSWFAYLTRPARCQLFLNRPQGHPQEEVPPAGVSSAVAGPWTRGTELRGQEAGFLPASGHNVLVKQSTCSFVLCVILLKLILSTHSQHTWGISRSVTQA